MEFALKQTPNLNGSRAFKISNFKIYYYYYRDGEVYLKLIIEKWYISLFMIDYVQYIWRLSSASNLEQVLAATPHKTPTVRPPAPYHENNSC